MSTDNKAGMITSFAGQRIASVTVTEQLEIDTEPGWSIVVENDYTFERPGQPALRTVDGQEPEIGTELETMVGLPLVDLSYTASGNLTVRFQGGDLVVKAAPFEAWSILGPNKERVISMPGGELAVWS